MRTYTWVTIQCKYHVWPRLCHLIALVLEEEESARIQGNWNNWTRHKKVFTRPFCTKWIYGKKLKRPWIKRQCCGVGLDIFKTENKMADLRHFQIWWCYSTLNPTFYLRIQLFLPKTSFFLEEIFNFNVFYCQSFLLSIFFYCQFL